MILKAYTWNRDSHGLFDYESSSIDTECKTIQETTNVFRSESLIKTSAFIPTGPNDVRLVGVARTANGFIISPATGGEMWQVIDCNRAKNSSKGFKLTKNDVVKLGRVRYTVKDVCGYELDGETPQPSIFIHIPSGSEGQVCRICLVEDEPSDPLIAPCNCGGTMKYIHLSCFKKWIESKTSKKQSDNSLSYCVKSLTCEISRCPIPPNIEVNGQMIDLLEIRNVPPPYITLESGFSDKNEYSIHLISLNNKNNVRLGRGHDSDIRISDISVSRCHAVIRYSDGEFHLEDNSSKFGTLIETQQVKIDKSNPMVCVQVGRTLMMFSLKGLDADNSVDETDEEQDQ